MNSWMVDMADTFTRCFIREDRYKLLISGIGVTIKVSIVAGYPWNFDRFFDCTL